MGGGGGVCSAPLGSGVCSTSLSLGGGMCSTPLSSGLLQSHVSSLSLPSVNAVSNTQVTTNVAQSRQDHNETFRFSMGCFVVVSKCEIDEIDKLLIIGCHDF